MRHLRHLRILSVAMSLSACGRGLPPEPPDHDAADPEAAIPRATPGPGPLDRSAFSEATLRGEGEDAGSMHHVHGHHGHGAASKPDDAAAGGHVGHVGHDGHTPAKEAEGEGHTRHGEAEAKHHAP